MAISRNATVIQEVIDAIKKKLLSKSSCDFAVFPSSNDGLVEAKNFFEEKEYPSNTKVTKASDVSTYKTTTPD